MQNNLKALLVLSFALLSCVTAPKPASAAGFDQDFYHRRYGLNDPYTKLVDNQGNGYDALYGVRNMREVLKGVLYRGGANNAYNKYGKRANQNPLPDMGLENLCKEGFGMAMYMYEKNFNTAHQTTTCASIRGNNTLTYKQLTFNTQQKETLSLIREAIMDNSKGPIYLHCWNGWHASGYLSAISLRQFCGITSAEALAYWNANTDGANGPGYDPIRKMVTSFQPDPALNIDPAIQARICPQLK